MKNKRNKIDTFNDAINGIIFAIKNEANMRIHILATITVLLMCLFINISKLEIMLIIVMIALVIFSELVNTAIEKIVDIVSPEYNEIAKIIKDVASGAVLVNAIASLAIAYLIFYDRLISFYFNGDNFIKLFGRIGNVTLIIITLVSVITIALKAYFHKGSALEGGMPSGHSAIAFSIYAIVLFINKNPRINVLVLLMAFLVAQSRVKSRIHTLKEVIIGALIGFSISYIILEILYKFGTLVIY